MLRQARKIILNSAIPLFDSDRRITGAIIVNQDITGRKRAEAEREAMFREHERLRLEALEANRSKDDFIATLSHELRTPLTAVLGWTKILKGALPNLQAVQRAAVAIERNARIQAQLLDDTLDMSRIVRGKVALTALDVDLAAVVGEVVEAMRPAALEKGVALAERANGDAATVHGDPTRLQQIVWNLLANALKFTPAGGHIEVTTCSDGQSVDVSVRDTGTGIASEFMPFLFDRFSQGTGSVARSRGGLGLGLAIVKELVELHGGTITAESAGPGRGATFTFRLPVGARAHEPAD
jgi:signal transduction histidine kinase